MTTLNSHLSTHSPALANKVCRVAALTLAGCLIATAANAQTARTQLERQHAVARGAVGAVGGAVGSTMCGSPCANAMRSGARGAYDTGRAFQGWAEPRLQAFGRNQVRPLIQPAPPRPR